MKKINVCLLLAMMLINLASAHHENLPPGQHVMPKGEIMQDSAMSGKVLTNQASQGPLFFIIGFVLLIILIVIWFARKKKESV